MRYEVTETAVLVCPWLGAELQLFMYYQSTEDGGGHEAERGLHLAEDEEAHEDGEGGGAHHDEAELERAEELGLG